MAHDESRAMDVLRAAAYIVPVCISMVLMGIGVAQIDQPWGVAVITVGFLGLFAIGVGKWQESPSLCTYGFFLIISGGLVWAGSTLGDSTWRYILMTGGVFGTFLAGLGAAISLQLNRLLGEDGGRHDTQLLQWMKILDQLEKIHDATIVSDASKRILFRDHELKLLRHRIDDAIGRGEYDAGLELCDAIEKAFDTSDVADAFRHRILRSRQDHHEAEIHGALDQFNLLLGQRDWARAHKEAARIRRLYPDAPVIGELDQRIHAARNEHKEELHGEFNRATEREDLPTAMRLLRELDRYLTREEAAQLAANAQSVVEKHRDNLTTRFKMAVSDHQWNEALKIGDLIVGEFPNTKVAEEVNSMVDVLKSRAIEDAAMTGRAGES